MHSHQKKQTTDREIEELEQKVRQGSASLEDYAILRMVYSESYRYDDLLKLLNLLISQSQLTDLNLATVYNEKGILLQRLTRLEEAIACFHQSLQILQTQDDALESENVVDALFLTAMNYLDLFSVESTDDSPHYAEEAIRACTSLLAHPLDDQKAYEIYCCLGMIYVHFEEYESAHLSYQRALDIATTTQDAVSTLVEIASTYGKQRKFEQAISTLDQAFQQAEHTLPLTAIYYEFGRLYTEMEHFSQASEAFRHALQSLQHDPALQADSEYIIDIYWRLGTLAYQEQHFEQAARYFLHVVEHIDDTHYYYADSHLTLGHCYLVREYYQEALMHYHHVLTASRCSPEQKTLALESIARLPSMYCQMH